MRLRVLLPARVLVDEQVAKVTAESVSGSFTLLPRHVDVVAPLAQGLLTFADAQERTTVLAVDGGVLVKCGADVFVSTPDAVPGPTLEDLEQSVDEVFRATVEEERAARVALTRIATDILDRLVELEELEHRGY